MKSRAIPHALATLLCVAFVAGLCAQPTAFTYQGRLIDGDAPATGQYDLRFELFDAETDGTSLGVFASPETQASSGLFIATLDFGEAALVSGERWLEIAARPGGSEETFTVLSPRQRLTAAPYALRALRSDTITASAIGSDMLADGAVTAEKIGPGAVTRSKIEPGAVSQLGAPDGSDSAAVQVTEDGMVGIKTADPSAGLHIASGAPILSLEPLFQASDGTSGFENLGGAEDVAVEGDLLAASASGDDAATLVDISDPANPMVLSQIQDGEGGFDNLDGVHGLALSGAVLAAAASADDAVSLIDISDPANPALHSVMRDGVGAFDDLAGAAGVAISGDLLAVAASGDDAVNLVDIGDPSAPQLRSTLKDGSFGFNEIDGALHVNLAGDLLAVAAPLDDAVTLVDVSDPSAPEFLSAMKDGVDGIEDLDHAFAAAISSDLMAIAAFKDDAVTLVDIADPTAPELLSVLRDGEGGFERLDLVVDLAWSGATLAVAARSEDAVTLVDVSDPQNPKPLGLGSQGAAGLRGLDSPRGVAFTGDDLIAVAAGNALSVLRTSPAKVGLASAERVGIGTTVPLAPLHVVGDLVVSAATDVNLQTERFSSGRGTVASGIASTAMGSSTTASGSSSTAIGFDTKASGSASTAMGRNAIASGLYSTAMGLSTTAEAFASIAMGSHSTASGGSSTAMGTATKASGFASIAMGSNTTANGFISTAMGENTTANGVASTAMGGNTTANGDFSTAMGSSTTASGIYSTAIGRNSTASSPDSTAMGRGAEARHSGSFVWADSSISKFSSIQNNEFAIRAHNGVRIVNRGNGATLLDFATERNWAFRQLNTGADTALELASIGGGGGKHFIINTTGHVGIGTTEPEFTLHVNGAAGKPGGGSWNSASDRRLKDVGPSFARGLEALEKIEPRRYRYAAGNPLGLPSDREYVGLVAQEVQAAIPEAIEPNDTGYLHLNNDPILWTMLNGIKELNRKLEEEVARLRADNAELKRRLAILEQGAE